ncbi:uncharacterized protein N7496_011322, partial [Penicillium cataractarum]
QIAMKIIVAGATGLVGSEIIRQCLDNNAVTEVIALARNPIQIDENTNSSKLKILLIEDYGHYPDHIKAEFVGADACIWTVAVTPFRSGNFDFDEVKRVCQSCTMTGLQAMYEAQQGRPFRFMYLSAEGTPDDTTKKPIFMGDYQIMRRETELQVREFSKNHTNIETCIARPGVVTNSKTWGRAALASMLQVTNYFWRFIPNVSRRELAAAVLSQVLHGFNGEMLSNEDLGRIGQELLRAKES